MKEGDEATVTRVGEGNWTYKGKRENGKKIWIKGLFEDIKNEEEKNRILMGR